MKVGWIGLGSIGAGMASRVLGAGHELTSYARGAGQDTVRAAGANLVSDYVQIASTSDVLGVCVFKDEQVREAILASGALAAMRPGSVLAIHTTGSPALAKEICASAPKGVETLDACFSGGPRETAEGKLALMVGGSDEGMGRARPILQTYADRIHHVGGAGAGQTLKLLNNLLFATNLRYAAEAIRLASEQGLDGALAAQVIQQSSGSSMAIGMFAGGRSPDQVFQVVRNYMIKDVSAAEAASREAGVDLSAFQSILEHYR